MGADRLGSSIHTSQEVVDQCTYRTVSQRVSLVAPNSDLEADAIAPPTAFPALSISDRSCTNSHAFQASNTSKDQVTLIR
jgi:hypothetical protein